MKLPDGVVRKQFTAAIVARKLMASRSQQSRAKATRTFSPLSQPISKPSEHQRRFRSSTAMRAIVTSLGATGVSVEQQAVDLHDPVNSLVVGRLTPLRQRLALEDRMNAP